MKRSTIILDMDNTLLENVDYSPNTDHMYDYNTIFLSRNGTSERDRNNNTAYFLILRSGVEQFLRILPYRFSQIFIWSAGKCNYVETTCYHLFSEVGYLPNGILTRDDCIPHKNWFHKPIAKVVKEYNADPRKTFLIDDSSLILEMNKEYKDNCIVVPRFFAKNGQDNVLHTLTDWVISLPEGSDSYVDHLKPIF